MDTKKHKTAPLYRLAGRTVALTGSTGDLGSALAPALHTLGARLALLDPDGTAAHTQAARLGSGATARAWQSDVRDLDTLTASLDAAAAHFGRIDITIANASIDIPAPLESIEPALYEQMIDTNLNGVWRTFRAALPHVSEQHGYLLATSTMAGYTRSPLQIPYSASKAAVWAMCNGLRLEVRHLGVGVGSVHPAALTGATPGRVLNDSAVRTPWTDATSSGHMIPMDSVVQAIITGIERRASQVILPRRPSPAARPGLVRPYVERFGSPGDTTRRDAQFTAPTKGSPHGPGTPAATHP
ncbi:SDR family NAD(P)-dependent oxidoreductase [Streptomyces sp. NPDC056488]|uniref:SDR family NAD(P)-dependent oxidoreductase n=1 Tax=Streptomyces sp. NPDC056488 TaxID=3345836 RepID=UPI00367F33A4